MLSLLRRHRALTAAKPSRRAALTFDRLDSRCLLGPVGPIAGPVVQNNNGVLTVTGTPKGDTVTVTVHESTIDVTWSTTVVINGKPKTSKPVTTEPPFNTSDVDSIVVNGNAGNDTLTVVFDPASNPWLPVTLSGGPGNDHIENKGGNNVTMDGGPGKNTLKPNPNPKLLSTLKPKALSGSFTVRELVKGNDEEGHLNSTGMIVYSNPARFDETSLHGQSTYTMISKYQWVVDIPSTINIIFSQDPQNFDFVTFIQGSIGSVDQVTADLKLLITPSKNFAAKFKEHQRIAVRWSIGGDITINYQGLEATVDGIGTFHSFEIIPIRVQGVAQEIVSKHGASIDMSFSGDYPNPMFSPPGTCHVDLHLVG